MIHIAIKSEWKVLTVSGKKKVKKLFLNKCFWWILRYGLCVCVFACVSVKSVYNLGPATLP